MANRRAQTTMHLVELIPSFSGKVGAVNEFIRKIEEVGQLNGWTNAEKLTILKLKITDEAERFVNINGQGVDDYDHIVNDLKLNFENKVPLTTHLQELAICTQGKGESVNEFGNRLRTIGRAILQAQGNAENPAVLESNDKVLLAKFCAGIKPELQRQVLSGNPATLENAIVLAKSEENNFKVFETNSKSRGLMYGSSEAASGENNGKDGDLIQGLTAQIARLSVEEN